MIAVYGQQGASLALVTLVSVGFLCAMCLRCRRKSRIIQEENHIYNPQLNRGGSRFTVIRSKTVTRPNQITRDPPSIPQGSLGVTCATSGVAEDQPNYQNIPKFQKGDLEPTYVNPLPNMPYENITQTSSDKDADTNSYENVFPTLANPITEDSDSSDSYANTSFLEEMKAEEDEPDYVNAETESKPEDSKPSSNELKRPNIMKAPCNYR